MNLRSRTTALALAMTSLFTGIGQAANESTKTPRPAQALSLEEQVAYSLVESMLRLATANVEHTDACRGTYDANVSVTKWTIDADGTASGSATSNIDDFDMQAILFTTESWRKSGTHVEVAGSGKDDTSELGNTQIRYRALFAFDPSGSRMVGGPLYIELDGDRLDPQEVKDFGDIAGLKDETRTISPHLGESKGRDQGLKLINGKVYPPIRWKKNSYLRRSNGGDGRILISRDLIAPGKFYSGCNVSFSAEVGNLGGGFQTIEGKVKLTAAGSKPVQSKFDPGTVLRKRQ